MNQQFNFGSQPTYYRKNKRPRRYGLSNFVGDLTLTGMTMGVWLIWILIRELSR